MRHTVVLPVILAIALPLSLLAGRVWIDPWSTPNAALILAELRLPRSLLAVIVGAGLGAAGAAMQGYLRNPLADPGLFGIGPGAALGAVTSLWLGYAASAWALPLFALIGAGGAMAPIVGWLNGALTDRGWHEVAIATPPILAGIALLRAAGPSLDALTLGDAAARSLGINPRHLLWLLIGGTALTVGAVTAVAGIIGFVGLIVPHLIRPLTDRRPSRLIVPSALGGALLVLVADSVVRVLPLMIELRLGIALSLLGAPFFLWLLLRMRRGQAW